MFPISEMRYTMNYPFKNQCRSLNPRVSQRNRFPLWGLRQTQSLPELRSRPFLSWETPNWNQWAFRGFLSHGGTYHVYGLFFRPKCQGISPENMAWNMVLTYFHFRILKFPLVWGGYFIETPSINVQARWNIPIRSQSKRDDLGVPPGLGNLYFRNLNWRYLPHS